MGSRRGRWLGAVAPLALVLLTGCEDGQLAFGGGGDTSPGIDGQTVQLVETDVEAPEVFQVTETGLWDGRPSLGGVWVAHPDVTSPERVIIRNQDNGAFVIGALFRRERENPGPLLQVSSDAAEALEMLAGSPATLNVIALRREEAAAPVATPATEPVDPDAPTATLDAADTIAATPLDPIAGAAAAAIDTAGAAGAGPSAAPLGAAATAAATPAASALDRPYIQLGIFSIEANAQSLADSMRANGMTARVVEQQSQGRTFWRVLVGPAQTTAERTALLDRVKAEGFADAYFVRN